jgi:dTDP-4-amino-4,6-dideoxygalactose transaminase
MRRRWIIGGTHPRNAATTRHQAGNELLVIPTIAKTATNPEACARPYRLFVNARSAFKSLLAALDFEPEARVLLPAYVGWSSREGSGVFDPIAELNLPHDFYRIDGQLHIDLGDLERRLQTGNVKVVVLIHYFGYVDPQYQAAVDMARRHGAWVIEDEAHALLSDWVGGVCGRLGDACIYSLHKMLPMAGGMLAVPSRHAGLLARVESGGDIPSPWAYDFAAMAQRRRDNARYLAHLLTPLADDVTLLRPSLAAGEAPQTLPVLIRRVSRDGLYFALNEAGFGAVSLYHTLIPQISRDAFPDSHQLARTILNLPVHQDVQTDQLDALVEKLWEMMKGHGYRPHFILPQFSSV